MLAPCFYGRQFFLIPTLLNTKRVKDGANFKGGVTRYQKFLHDLRKLLQGSGGSLVTTLLDYYGLPVDFPGMETRPSGTPAERARHVDTAMHNHVGDPENYRPFLALHEFEA